MGNLSSTINALANFNAVTGSFLNYNEETKKGVSTVDALSNLSWNIAGGLLRNQASKAIADTTGSYLGYAINSNAGYGTAEANEKGTAGTILAAQLSSPWGMFGGIPYMTSYYGGAMPYAMPFGIVGGGCHHHRHHCHTSFMPSFFTMGGIWC